MKKTVNKETIALDSLQLIEMGLEPRSAIKQAAFDNGIPYGLEMKTIVSEIEKMLNL